MTTSELLMILERNEIKVKQYMNDLNFKKYTDNILDASSIQKKKIENKKTIATPKAQSNKPQLPNSS